ncbi:hypothetical protein AKJ16_DCAP00748 [Drosera capensis]
MSRVENSSLCAHRTAPSRVEKLPCVSTKLETELDSYFVMSDLFVNFRWLRLVAYWGYSQIDWFWSYIASSVSID